MTKSRIETKVDKTNSIDEVDVATPSTGDQAIQGRGVFSSEITAAGVAVSTAFLAEDGRIFPMPAVFPNLQYALAQIDELRQIVTNQFGQAAQVGAQVIAAEVASRANTASAIDDAVSEEVSDEGAGLSSRSLQ